MNAYDRLCHTRDYNVTFERGNLTRQRARVLGNVDALLHAGGATIEAMSHFIVYLRDSSDYNVVEACFADKFFKCPAPDSARPAMPP